MGIKVGELYDPESKKRKRLATKYKIFRFFGYNPTMMAFKRTCAFCLTELTDDTVEGVWSRGTIKFTSYTEEHKCSCCKQNWSYNRGPVRGKYKFDAEWEREIKLFEPLREKNNKVIQEMLDMSNKRSKKE